MPGCEGCKGRGVGLLAKPDAAAPDSRQQGHILEVTPEEVALLPPRLNASHILIVHKDAFRAPAWVTRTADEALARAEELAVQVRKDPGLLPTLARKFSEAPRAMEGGYLGNWPQGKMVRPFEIAVARLRPGEVGGPLETSFGYHILRREELLEEKEISGAHILIAHRNALRAPATVTRSPLEAEVLATELLNRLGKEPHNFEALMSRHSDGPRARRGGGLGLWTSGTGKRPAVVDGALLATPEDSLYPALVQTPFGFHILKRLVVSRPALLSGAHILVAYKGAKRAPASLTRTQAQARTLANNLYRELRRRPSDFPTLAKRHSNDASARVGGDLGRWPRGQFYPAFEDVLEQLKPLEISKPVETPFGYHLIRRLPVN